MKSHLAVAAFRLARVALAIGVGAWVAVCGAAGAGEARPAEGVYFGSFAGYDLPLKPVERLGREEALARGSYCVAHYGNDGRMVRFERYVDGRLFFRHDYAFHPDGKLREVRLTDPEGKERVNAFDASGRLEGKE